MGLEIDPTLLIDRDPLGFQQQALLLETASDRQGDASSAVDDPVPGQFVICGTGVQHPGDLPGGAVVSGIGGDLPVGGDSAAGDAGDQALDPLAERITLFGHLSIIAQPGAAVLPL
jgi:hypothetical protein